MAPNNKNANRLLIGDTVPNTNLWLSYLGALTLIKAWQKPALPAPLFNRLVPGGTEAQREAENFGKQPSSAILPMGAGHILPQGRGPAGYGLCQGPGGF